MQTIHISAEENTIQKVLKYLENLSSNGENIELLDEETFAYEKKLIDLSLKNVEQGKVVPFHEIKKEFGL